MVKLAETTALLHCRNIRSQTVRALWCHGFPWQSTLLGKGLWTSLTATWLRWEHWESTPVYCPQQPQAAQKLPFWVPRTMHADRRWFARHVREKWRGVHWVRLIVIGRSWDVLDCLEYLRISPYCVGRCLVRWAHYSPNLEICRRLARLLVANSSNFSSWHKRARLQSKEGMVEDIVLRTHLQASTCPSTNLPNS